MAVLLEAGAELVIHLELLLGRQLPSERHHARERDGAWMGGRVRGQCDGVNLGVGRGDRGEIWGRWRGGGACADEGPVVDMHGQAHDELAVDAVEDAAWEIWARSGGDLGRSGRRGRRRRLVREM